MVRRIIQRLHKIRKEYLRYKSQNWGNWWNFRHGFLPKSIEVCGITRENYRNFISDVDYVNGHPYNGMYSSIIDNKLYLPFLLHDFKEYIPQYYFFKDLCGFLHLCDYSTSRVDVEVVLAKLRETRSLVCKRVADSLGKGFFLIEYENEGRVFVNKKISTMSEIKQLLNSLQNYIISECVKNHPYAASAAPASLNTIRLLFVWDDEKKEFFVPRAFHRFGCAGSVVDNLAAGNGILVYMNPNTGELLDEGVISKNGKDAYVRDIMIHPDNSVKLTGVRVPNFSRIVKTCHDIFSRHSYLRYFGVDIAVTNDGFKIIEINSLTTLATIQQRKGFLADERIRKIFKVSRNTFQLRC